MKNFNCIIKGIIITLGKSDSVSPVTCSKMFYKKHAARNVYTPSTQSNNSVFVCVREQAHGCLLVCVRVLITSHFQNALSVIVFHIHLLYFMMSTFRHTV